MASKFFKVSLALCALTIMSLSCKKENANPDYEFTIVVRSFEDSLLVQNAKVEAYIPSGIENSDVLELRFSDNNGEANFEYSAQAILEIRAYRGTRPDYSWIGCTQVRLEPNERVYKTVYIKPFDINEGQACQ